METLPVHGPKVTELHKTVLKNLGYYDELMSYIKAHEPIKLGDEAIHGYNTRLMVLVQGMVESMMDTYNTITELEAKGVLK